MVNGVIPSLYTIKNLKIREEHYYVHVLLNSFLHLMAGFFFHCHGDYLYIPIAQTNNIHQTNLIPPPPQGIPKPGSFMTGTLFDNLW